MKPIVLAILDGVGIREETHGNAFKQAYTPAFNHLMRTYPHSLLEASGEAVGLPAGQMGNSEVGHLNIGAGRIVLQPLLMINQALEDGSFYHNKSLLDVITYTKKNKRKLHVLGLVSDGGVHSHLSHILGILALCKKEQVEQVYFHVITDGRDTLPNAATKYLKQLTAGFKEHNLGVIATIMGRYYAMDRDRRWDRTELAYKALTNGEGPRFSDYIDVVNEKVQDEFIIPSILDEEGVINNGDGLIFANFRPDRATQILTALTNPLFKSFPTKTMTALKLVSLMPCAQSVIGEHAFTGPVLKDTLGSYLAALNYTQLRIAETEKYAHVTYFFDGGRDFQLPGCDRVLIKSPLVKTYDLKPEMSAGEITDKLLTLLDTNKYDVIILNYANGDMVGHTGDFEATKQAVTVVDENLGRLYRKVKSLGGLLIVTADHGNCEYMEDEQNNIITAHTSNKVPLIVCHKNYQVQDGKLADIAPTILALLRVEKPDLMTGEVLVKVID